MDPVSIAKTVTESGQNHIIFMEVLIWASLLLSLGVFGKWMLKRTEDRDKSFTELLEKYSQTNQKTYELLGKASDVMDKSRATNEEVVVILSRIVAKLDTITKN